MQSEVTLYDKINIDTLEWGGSENNYSQIKMEKMFIGRIL